MAMVILLTQWKAQQLHRSSEPVHQAQVEPHHGEEVRRPHALERGPSHLPEPPGLQAAMVGELGDLLQVRPDRGSQHGARTWWILEPAWPTSRTSSGNRGAASPPAASADRRACAT